MAPVTGPVPYLQEEDLALPPWEGSLRGLPCILVPDFSGNSQLSSLLFGSSSLPSIQLVGKSISMYPALANLTTSAPCQVVHATVGGKGGPCPPLVRHGDLWGVRIQ